MSFTFESVGPETALSVAGIYMLDDSGAFEITSVTRVEPGIELEFPYNTIVPLYEHVEIVVEFAPTYEGMFAGQILIMSNAINFPSY